MMHANLAILRIKVSGFFGGSEERYPVSRAQQRGDHRAQVSRNPRPVTVVVRRLGGNKTYIQFATVAFFRATKIRWPAKSSGARSLNQRIP